MRRQFQLTVLCFCTCLAISAQTANDVRTFTVRDGLPSNAITAIEEDNRGLLWLSTWNGLCCYDGYRFTSFWGKEWGDDHALSSRRISMIEPDSQGNIWVRTYNGGLYLLNTRQCEYTNIGLLLERKYGKTILPRNIYSLSTGYTWITDEHGEQNLRIDDRYPTDIEKIEVINIKDIPLNHYIKKVETDPQGHEWMITDAGMIRYGTKEVRKGVFTNYPDENKTPTLSEQWIKNHPELGISKAFTDHQGNLWYSSPIGLTLVNFRNYAMRQFIVEPRQQTRSVACRKDGTVWVGSNGGYIAIFNNDGQQKGWLSPQGKISTNMIRFADRIYTMCEDNKGNMWIGTRGQGIYVVMAGEPSVKHYMHQDADPYSLSHNDVYDIDQDNEGQIWIATYGGGVNLVRSEELRFLHKGNDLKHYPQEGFDKVRRIIHDHKGNMLASTTWGLMTFASHTNNPQDLRFYLTRQKQNDISSLRTNDVMQVLVTRQGDIYVLTVGGCIQKLVSDNLQEDQLKFETPLNMDRGIGSSLSMVEDRQGFVWIIRESEINRYDTKTDQLVRFGPNSMDINAQITEAKPVIDASGKLWAGTSSGVLSLDTHQIQRSDYKPNIVFTNILFQGEDVEHPIIGRQVINITEREQRNLTIRFAALDYSDNYLMEYAYRMKESGEEWNYIGNDPHIAFSQLSAGEHTLIVKSTNCDGVWVDNATELLIDVKPMFWERLWVRLLALLIMIGLSMLALVAYLSHRRQARERDKRLESILSQYRQLEEQIQSETKEKREYRLREPDIVVTDELMMNNLMEYIDRRINDESLKVEEMAEAVGMGRTAFFEKMKELVGISPSDFLRQVRMQRACQLLQKSKLTVSEIAYSVGFSDPKYFTKCFKKEFGKTPSEYKNTPLSYDNI